MGTLHVTESASERDFSKLRQLNDPAREPIKASNGPGKASLPVADSEAAPATTTVSSLSIRSLAKNENLHRQKKKYGFGGSFARLRAKREGETRTTTSLGNILLMREGSAKNRQISSTKILIDVNKFRNEKFLDLFFALPPEIHLEIISHLSIPQILILRLVSQRFHNFVTSNEDVIARCHIANSLPNSIVKLYRPPENGTAVFHYLLSIWHRLHVISKFANLVTEQAMPEVYFRNTEARRQSFKPDEDRLRRRLIRRILIIFHFLERYRELHVCHLLSSGFSLSRQVSTTNLFERIVLEDYSDDDLVKTHEVFPMVISYLSGQLERSIDYPRDKPADEIYSAILLVGGLHQACYFWNIEDFHARRTAVSTWYDHLVQRAAKPRTSIKGRLSSLGRKITRSENDTVPSDISSDKKQWRHSWYSPRPKSTHHTEENGPVLSTSLSEGQPMSALTKEELHLYLLDLPHISDIWVHTAEAVILERGLRKSPRDIKSNAMILLELTRDGGTDLDEDWENMLSK